MLERTIYSAIALATLCLCISFAVVGAWALAAIWLGFGLLWIYLERRKSHALAVLGLLLAIGAAAYASFLGIIALPLVVAVIAALVAWESSRLAHRLRSFEQSEHSDAMVEQHQKRLIWAALLGVVLTLLASLVQLPLAFGWALVLVLIAIIGLVTMLRMINETN
jgi:hypothetical protein